MPRPILLVVTASTRSGRVGDRVAAWFAALAREHGDFDVETADLRTDGPPLLHSAGHPGYQEYDGPEVWRWSRLVNRADAIAVVSPEYDYALPASLLNAFQTLYLEWGYKPIGLVTYGGVSGGLRAAQTIRTMASTLLMFVVETGVAIPHVTGQLDAEAFAPDGRQAASSSRMLDELVLVSEAFETLRGERRRGIVEGPP